MPLISVVVPIHDVEPYLAECLQSIASQTHSELEVVMVDDGSTDASAQIAAHFASRDPRFRLIGQPNGGLSRARNAGASVASGDFLAFVDSDDVLPHDAYERMHRSLAASGSDFACGNVSRLTARGVEPAPFLASTFAQTRTATHVTRCRPLIADRTAWNKLFRRSFWDANGFAFPDGRVHEDIPVMLPAHFKAGAVDVLSAPVYLWRQRDDGSRSITQRRLERRVMSDRLTAIEEVRAFLAAGFRTAARWYDERLVTDDLRLHLELLHEADAEYRREFMDRATAMLETVAPRVFKRLPAVNRLEWHLLRRGLVDEAAEVARFAAEEASSTAPIRRRGRYYGDYPFRTDPELKVPRSLYRLGRADAELALTATLEQVACEDAALAIRGHAHILGLGAADRGSQRVVIGAVRKGRWRRLRRHLRPIRATTTEVYRPDLIARGRRRLAWAGFDARFDASQLTGPSFNARYEVFAYVRSGFVTRRRARFAVPGPGLLPAVHLPDRDGVLIRAGVSSAGALTLDVRTRWLRLDHARGESGRIALSGAARLGGCSGTLELRRRSDQAVLAFPLDVRGDRFQAGILTDAVRHARPPLEVEAAPRIASQQVWELWAVVDGRAHAVALPAQQRGAMWTSGDRELLLVPTPDGHATLVERDRVATADTASDIAVVPAAG